MDYKATIKIHEVEDYVLAWDSYWSIVKATKTLFNNAALL